MENGVVSDVIVEGSPLFTPDLILNYLVFFGLFSLISYLIVHKVRKPQNPNHLKNYIFFALIFKVIIVTIVAGFAAFYLLPSPHVISSSPSANSQNHDVTKNIEIQFDRPVSRVDLEKTISPSMPGIWKFEVGFYKTHFYRKLVFYPDVNFLPEVEYKVELKNIKNVTKLTNGHSYSFSYKTEKLPQVQSITPTHNSKDAKLDSTIEVKLDKPNYDIASFDFLIKPETSFSVKKSQDSTIYYLEPKEKLKQATDYQIEISKSRLTKNRNGEIVFIGTKYPEIKSGFKTAPPPNVANFTPSGDNVRINSILEIKFTKKINPTTLQKAIVVNPALEGEIIEKEANTLAIIPKNLSFNTQYKIQIPRGLAAADGTTTDEDINLEFKTIGPVKLVSTISTSTTADAIGIRNNIKLNFDQAVDKNSAQEHFSISPAVSGSFAWEENTMIFTPTDSFRHDTKYQIAMSPGIKSIDGQNSEDTFTTNFTTESFVLKLNVPAFLQKYTLSCEAATLRMVLAFKGIYENEDDILKQIGFDATPKQGNVWGDPHSAFVGEVNGKQMISGYGVYWEPIEKVAKKYRDAKSFTNGTIQNLTEHLKNGHAIQVWTFSKGGVPTTWETKNGKKIHAVSGEHSIVVKGFIGPAENPKQIIVNDPLVGEMHLSQGEFAAKWNSFSRSGVVVF